MGFRVISKLVDKRNHIELVFLKLKVQVKKAVPQEG